jgi:uncharacterized protein YigA (DUF484 family)
MSSITTQRQEGQAVTAADVEDYLRHHADFFQGHEALLEILKVPHPSGEAVSLVARQLDLLRDRNRRLQVQLNDILQIARDNDALYHRIHQLTLALLHATSPDDALAGLKWSLHQYFQADFVAVRVFRPAIVTPIRDFWISPEDERLRLFEDILDSGKPVCEKPDAIRAEFLFGKDVPEVLSYALVPLVHAGLEGLLAIGSRNQHRFQPGMGLLFLSQMGEIVSARFASLLGGQI